MFIRIMVLGGFFITQFLIYGQPDSVILSYSEYLSNIVAYHPIAKQANLRLRMAEAEFLGAKGNLDPMISSAWDEKNFDEKLYFRRYGAKLRFPTKFGIDFVGEYENADGVFLNPENLTDDYGLWNIGVEVDALQGLVINERNIALDQARVFQELAKSEQEIILNDLLYQSSLAYLEWQKVHYFGGILLENISISENFLQNTKQSFFNGDKTAMDTLEAFILYQDAVSHYQRNQVDMLEAKREIENYLWYDGQPVSLSTVAVPQDYGNRMFDEVVTIGDTLLEGHPVIREVQNKYSYLEVEQRLKREKLKPKLKIKYRPIFGTAENSLAPTYVVSDYKWGFDFSMPLFFRSEKADLTRGEVKLQELQLNLDNKRNELRNKVQRSWQQHLLLRQQRNLLAVNVEKYGELLDGETEKFNYGESSLFLVNKRQEKYIQGRLKLIETHIKQETQLLKLLYYSNQLVVP